MKYNLQCGIFVQQYNGHLIRSRAQWIEEGEKCTEYFMQLENRNYKTKCITTLSKNDHKITEQTDILEECRTFYKQLYSETIVENNFENCKFFATKHETLDEIEKILCEQEVTVVECHESLIEFPNNKCPGSDGLTVDFYKFF